MKHGKHNKRIGGLLGLLVFFVSVVVQSIAQPSYVFLHLTTKDGLSNGNVSSILKDSYGFLWVGTEYGLNRYDGYGFKTYTTEANLSNSMLSNNIQGMQEDGLGNIWISTGTYTVYNRDKDNFINDVPGFLQRFEIVVDGNYRVYIDEEKDLWVLNGQQLFFYDTQKEVLKTFSLNLRLDDVVAVELSDDGKNLYSFLRPGLLWQINKQTGRQQVLDLPDDFNPQLDNKLYADYKGGLWLWSSSTDVVFYRKKPTVAWVRLQLKTEGQPKRMLRFMDDRNGHIWIGTDHNGLLIYNVASGEVINLQEDQNISSSIASNHIEYLYHDDNGIIWIGHNKNGISYYHNSLQSVVNVEQANCEDVSVILEDSGGRIWLGTDGNGLFVKDKKKGIRQLSVPKSPIVSLLEDRKGRIWIGTYLDGLYRYDNGKVDRFSTENSDLAGNNIWSLKEDRYGNLWIGTLGGAIQLLRNGEEDLNSMEIECEGMQHPMDMFYDGGDKLYIATVYGLYIVDIKTNDCSSYLGNRSGTQNFKQGLISSVYKDSRDNIWLGHAEGLSLWDVKKDTIYYIDKTNGLRDNIIRGIVEDDHQNLWVTTSNGLSVITAEQDRQGNLMITCENFTDEDGLIDNYFNNRAICKVRSGDILVGGTEGYSVVNPNKMLEKNQPPAKVIFTGLSVGIDQIAVDSLYKGRKLLERPMELTRSLTFRYTDKLIQIKYTTGDLLYPNKVRYAYRMKALQEQWQNTSENRIVFSSLAPGDYELEIKACNSDGEWSDQVTYLDIKVTPPFYLSGWAWGLYILSGISFVVYSIYRSRRKQKMKLEAQRLQLVREQETNLYEMKLRFFTNISHDLRTPLTLILTPLQTLLNGSMDAGLRKKLEMINKSAEQLLHIINTLLDFRKLDAGGEVLRSKQGDLVSFIRELCFTFQGTAAERQIEFSFDSKLKVLTTQFDPDKLRKVMLNLLSNAFKFTPDGGVVTVCISREDDDIYLSVSDSGDGILDIDKPHVFDRFFQSSRHPEKTGSGIGLHIVNEYVRLHEGSITVEDNKPQGSTFLVRLPVWNEDIQDELSDDTTGNEEQFEQEQEVEQRIAANPVLLFVDDNKDFCEFMADSLSDEYTVLVAYNGQEALDQLQENDISIVVSDVMMPVMSGTELCEKIKTNIQWSHIPVILLTARTTEEYQLEGLKLGADDYLTKPFNFNLLKLRIRKFLEWTEKCHLSFSQKMDVSPSEITITSLDEQLIEDAIKAVEEHIDDPEFSVEDLGSLVGLSRGHLYKKLMSITGKGPAEFIRTIRLKRGRQLLEKSQLHIAEIAYAVGFNSPKRFSVNFKNEFGISPSDYLRRLNNPN
ncbi:hybrid sensor histidine kinase/response regulator transcription factor [Maribellus sediminis]|uniref:hybrid sensor histidine kinase/response regulator transcription factor n=1 Tax=Maribellus sediminis TaxID=2696285 RepID=UPI0014310338|nr:hybrid sensor histidine kinase/response regulator transcription factor [Maribellus sediminis]